MKKIKLSKLLKVICLLIILIGMFNRLFTSKIGYKKESINNLNIYHKNNDNSETIKYINMVINIEGWKLTPYFNNIQDKEINVIVKDRIPKIFTFSKFEAPAAYYPNSSEIVIINYASFKKDAPSLGAYKATIFHEYSHLLLHEEAKAILGEDISLPSWFYEGVARYFEKKFYMKPNDITTNTYAGDITKNSNFKRKDADKFYENAGYVLKYMFENYGQTFLIDLFNDMKNGNDIYVAIENVMGESFESIQNKGLIK